MKLEIYLEVNGLTKRDFAKVTDIPIDSIYRWLRGSHTPQPLYIKIIERATKGKVTKKDWS